MSDGPLAELALSGSTGALDITGACGVGEVARSGQWAYNAHLTGGQTEFVLESFAEMCDEQEGWYLQPDINRQAWFPITQANKQSHTVTISGDHTNLGTQGTRFRIYAPPGVQTKVPYAGLLPKFAEAASSRYLYRGYRYESPAAGRWDNTSQSVAARQGGNNFTGQHYTLFRHYDPSLMRFTSLDPLASSSNLFAYCENNPHSSYDPDGLYAIGDWTRSGWQWVDETFFGDSGWATGVGRIAGGGADFFVSGLAIPVQHLTWAFTGEAPDNWKMWQSVKSNTSKRWDLMTEAGSNNWDKVSTVGVLAASDMAGVTTFAEGYHKGDSVTGNRLSDKEANARLLEGTFMMAMYALSMGEGLVRMGPKCFVAGTQVLANDHGSTTAKNIEDIKVGDEVWSRDEDTGEEGFKPVTRLYVSETATLVHLSYRREGGSKQNNNNGHEGGDAEDGDGPNTLIGTPGHPFWSLTRQKWVRMASLRVGERLRLDDGVATVTACRVEQCTAPVKVYNFEVEGWHTYFVAPAAGQPFVWTHNQCAPKGTSRPKVKTSLPDRVTKALPEGEIRTPAEVKQARNFFERNKPVAESWYEARTGEPYPTKRATHHEHPRAIKDGGDPLRIEPGFNGPSAPHMKPKPPNGLSDFQRWGKMGGRPRKKGG